MTSAQVFIVAYILGIFCGMGWGYAAGQSTKKQHKGSKDDRWNEH
jgi:hypothetical protein